MNTVLGVLHLSEPVVNQKGLVNSARLLLLFTRIPDLVCRSEARTFIFTLVIHALGAYDLSYKSQNNRMIWRSDRTRGE